MYRRALLLFLLTVLAASTAVVACNVPVFRYALERWPADLYEVIVLHDGQLDAGSQAQVDILRRSNNKSALSANFQVRAVDVSSTRDAGLKEVWKQHGKDGKPIVVTLYPRAAQEVPDRLVGTMPLSEDAISRLVDSPVRQQVTKNLLSGDSAVWIFVPTGDEGQDARARQTLETHLRRNEEELELPPQDDIENDEFFIAENPIELRLGFSIVTLDRDDPKEQFLLQMLLGSEPDLEELDQPMAFPVIGRGRVLYALVGKGIFRDTISMASRFVVGPCSCQVKDQNPGFDLLIATNWDEKLGGAVISQAASLQQSKKPILIEIPPGK